MDYDVQERSDCQPDDQGDNDKQQVRGHDGAGEMRRDKPVVKPTR